MAETTDYGIGLTDETIAQNKSGNFGFEIQKITFDNKATDFTAQLLQVKAFKPDLVLNIAVGTPVDLIMDQATTVGLLPTTPMLISYDAPTRPQYWKLHPKNGEGIYFIAYYSPKAPLSDLGKAFAETYKEKYKEDPVYGALNGFGAIMIIAEALKAANSTDPEGADQGARDRHLQELARCAGDLPARRWRLLAQLGAAGPDHAVHQAEPGLEGSGRRRHVFQEVTRKVETTVGCFRPNSSSRPRSRES